MTCSRGLTKLPMMSGVPAASKAGTCLSMTDIRDRAPSAPMNAQKLMATFPRCGRERSWRPRRRWRGLGRRLLGGGTKKGFRNWSILTCHSVGRSMRAGGLSPVAVVTRTPKGMVYVCVYAYAMLSHGFSTVACGKTWPVVPSIGRSCV